MASLNKVVLIGNLTRDPELRSTPKGMPFCMMGLAVNRRFKDEAGNVRDDPTFVDIEAWGKTAELVSKYLKCGSPAFVEGRLKLDQWEDKESHQKRSRLKVVMERVQFLNSGPGRDKEEALETVSHENPGKGRRARAAAHAATLPGEDIPF